MRFGVLGPVSVWTDDGTAVTVPGTKVRALLADLLVHRGTVVSVDRLVADLWEREPPDRPQNALQGKVSRLRRALDDAEPGARDLVASRGPGYVLDVPADAVDTGRFVALADAGRVEEALGMWRGPAFADVADTAFARVAAEELEQRRLAVLEAHLDARSERGDDDAVIAELTTLVGSHPLRERSHATLMRALYRTGRQAEALLRYDELRSALADELGVDPSPELSALHAAILRHDPDLARPGNARSRAGRPDGRADAARTPSNLPAAWDETVGREDEIAALRRALGQERLVTVVGPGGVGKTRLALEVARTVAPGTAPDGVWFVDLSAVEPGPDGDDPVAAAVADALALRDDGPEPEATHPGARVADALRDRDLVLVLDNCEHVVDAAAAFAARLLRHAPAVRMLATSREPLEIRGEHLRPVEPLDVPVGDTDPSSSTAVRLFATRAAEADPAFALTAHTAPVVAVICRRLDGLPLALELAAARVRTLGLRAVADRLGDRLEDRFALLDSGRRDVPARQRTLRAVVDWSWEPLSEVERAVLRRLSVVGDSADADLVEVVCAGDPVPPGGVLPVLARLVERSLVIAVGTGAAEDRTRWRMLETVAAYAGERLAEAGEAASARRRHAEGCAALLERATPGLRGPDQAGWLLRLDRDAAEVRVALESAVTAGDGALALRIVVGAGWYWHLRGRRGTAGRAFARALAVADGPSLARAEAAAAHAALLVRERAVDDAVAVSRTALAEFDGLDEPGTSAALAFARWSHATALGRVGGIEVGHDLLVAALDGFRALGDEWGVAVVQGELGVHHVMAGRLDDARAAADEAERILDALGDSWAGTQVADLLGNLEEIAGDYAAATRRHRDGLRRAEQLRLWPSVISHRNRLGRLALLAGDTDAADAHHGVALALAREHGYGPAATFARLGLGMSARRRGRLDEADRHLEALLASRGESDHGPGNAITFAELGFVAELRGDADAARRAHRTGLDAARRAGDARAVALAVEGLAGVAVLDGDHRRAAELLGAAEAARAGVGAPLPPAERGDVDRVAGAARTALGTAEFDAARDRGRSRTPDEVVGPDA